MADATPNPETAAVPPVQPPMDFASILSKIQMLEKEKSDMRAQLEMATIKLSKLQVCLHYYTTIMHAFSFLYAVCGIVSQSSFAGVQAC
jgi:hypothetical protein